MTEETLGNALLRQEAADSDTNVQARQQASATIDRQRRRIRLLGVAVVLAAILAVAAVGSIYGIVVTWYSPPVLEAVLQSGTEAGEWSNEGQVAINQHWINRIQWMSRLTVAFGVCLVLTISGMVLLVFLSRRLTMQQLRADLAEMSGQLRQLHEDLRAAAANRH